MASKNKRTIYLGLDYSQFTGGVTEVNRKMALLDAEFKLAQQQAKNYGNETDTLGLKTEYLTQKIALQNQKVNEAKKAYDAAMASENASAKEIDELDKRLLQERLKLEQLNGQLKENIEKTNSATESNRSLDGEIALLDARFKLAAQQAQNYGSETDQLAVKQNYLTERIAVQNQKVEEAKRAYDAAIASNEASQAEIDDLDKKLLDERLKLEQLNGELADNKQATDKATGANKSFGDEIRGVASSLGLNISPALEKLAKKFDGVSAAVGNAVLGIGAMITGLVKCSMAVAETADELLTLSSTTGLTTDELQKMQYASKFVDVDMNTLTGTMTKLEKSMSQARQGNDAASEAFKKLHIRVTDSRGAFRDQNEVFMEAIDALGKVKNETERDVLAMQIFGKSAKELNPLIEAGSKKLNELYTEAEQLGVVMSETDVKAASELQDAFDRFASTSDALKNSLGMALLPILTTLFDAISRIPTPVLQTLVVLAGIVTTIVLVVKAIKSLTATGEAIGNFFKQFTTTGSKTAIVIIAVVAALVALAAIIAVIIGKSDDLNHTMENIGDSTQKLTDNVNGAQDRVRRAQVNAVGRNASGTDYWQGGSTWVGEEGPELVTIPRGSRITPAGEAAGTGTTINNYYMTIEAKTVKEFNDVVELAQQQRMALRRT